VQNPEMWKERENCQMVGVMVLTSLMIEWNTGSIIMVMVSRNTGAIFVEEPPKSDITNLAHFLWGNLLPNNRYNPIVRKH